MFTMECTEDCPGVVTVLEITRSGKKLIFEVERSEPDNDWGDNSNNECVILDRGQIENLHAQLTKWLATPKAPAYKGKVSGKI